MLEQILSDADTPCVGCSWESSCDGCAEQRQMAEELAKNPEDRCLICGGSALGHVRGSKLIAGTFHYCDEADDEYVFIPLEVSVQDSSAEAIEF